MSAENSAENPAEKPSAITASATAYRDAAPAEPPRALVGFDGFIDRIVHIVDKRTSVNDWTRIPTIAAYAQRLAAAAGRSTNVELVLQQEKMGGNGPLLADALGRLGLHVTTAGAFGGEHFHPLFEPLKDHGAAVSLCDAAVTIAAEFDDGKIMHGLMESLSEITFERVMERLGGDEALDQMLRDIDVCGLVNWTMTPHLTSVWRGLSERVQDLNGQGPKVWFFDLCDPQKRPAEDLREALEVIATFSRSGGAAVLGLNEKESYAVCEALALEPGPDSHTGLLERISAIRGKTGIPEVVIHPHHFAAAAGPAGSGAADGPYCRRPKLTTGAGDHFNGGYVSARLRGLSPEQAVIIGQAASGFYVRQGRGPSGEELTRFCELWAEGTLDPWKPVGD